MIYVTNNIVFKIEYLKQLITKVGNTTKDLDKHLKSRKWSDDLLRKFRHMACLKS